MNKFKKYLMAALVAVAAVAGVTSCSDDIPSESYYTFKGEMLSDYLRNRPEFSDFTTIVTRAGKMDLLSTYGRYTCFAPTNDAVQLYLRQNNITSLEQLSDQDCDTIASTAIVEYIYGTSDFVGVNFLGRTNMLGRNLSVESTPVIENGDTVNTTYRINRTGLIIMSLANDSVENGIVHPVSEMVVASNLTLPTVMKEDPNISIFNTALALTGLDQQMVRIEDTSYDPEYWRRGSLKEGIRFSGA
ncbi:MAG: fasciclin domain-containing protein, partial [Bacteroidaceae bacterium]|nr:fasciclin domain-containing protein [Bacteroidaceae bacterium]